MHNSAVKIKDELANLRGEVVLLRSAIISLLGEDQEGQYRPEFVKKILKAATEKPKFAFNGSAEFLKQLKSTQ